MTLFKLIAVFVVFVTTMLASERRTVFIDRMQGFEPTIEKAFRDAELPFDFVEEEKKPEMKVDLKRMYSAYGEILYKQKLGRHETHRFEFREVETGNVLAWHFFQLSSDRRSRERAAAEFAAKVKKAINRK